MDVPHKIDIDQFRYNLEDVRIAKYPLDHRDQSKLLFYDRGRISQHSFSGLTGIIPENAMLVFNNTRVIQARLKFRKETGAGIEIFCLEPHDPAEYQKAFTATGSCSWKCLVGNMRKWKSGPLLLSSVVNGHEIILEAVVGERSRENMTIHFHWNSEVVTFGEIIETAGSTPIPPYLKRESEEIDRERYQTIYKRDPGSVAAPTAGLHFTEEVIRQIREQGIRTAEITLHVGAGTFVPVKEDDARDHPMHAEQVSVPLEFLKQWAGHPGGLIAVGTTTTRSLESLYWLGVKLTEGLNMVHSKLDLRQWENEQLPQGVSLSESLDALIKYCRAQELDHVQFSTRLMIVPGYKFRSVNGLITNFHLPGSTLLLLIAALIGEDWKKVYDYALEHQFRFLSYGDSSLLLPAGN